MAAFASEGCAPTASAAPDAQSDCRALIAPAALFTTPAALSSTQHTAYKPTYLPKAGLPRCRCHLTEADVRTNRTVMRFYDLAAELTRGVAELAAALEPREPLLAAELRGRGPRGVAELASQAAHYPAACLDRTARRPHHLLLSAYCLPTANSC